MLGKGTLVFMCGKMGAGKSTLSRNITTERQAILLSEDEWLAAIYPDEIKSFEDYLKFSRRLKPLLKRHVQSLLNAGLSVVMDFPANTRNQRAWFKEIFVECGAPHELVYLDASDEKCLRQIGQRRESHPERAHFDTEAVFHQVTAYFQAPTEDEGFNVNLVGGKTA